MFKIVRKERLNPTTTLMDIEAPLVARRALPGQFIIFRVDEAGERIPLTIAGYDREKGTVTIIFQIVGLSTQRLNEKEEGEYIQDFVGPLGHPSECENFGRVAVIGGGLGVAIAYPQAKALKEAGNEVDFIVGFRNKDLVILEDEFRSNCGNLFLLTDDGSYGEKGFVTAALQRQLDAGVKYDRIIAIGPLPMMKAVCDMTRPHGIKTIISMNTIMI
ncbi:MAG: sulfide/dihydroorotate dehydrogenase-like FAD/NAD-binding protein, partial [Firmicutes bacterium]|nr:sulfide/dihydroorotate dehydrogenase-like FAD/NAD-binding protein [Bacillota bacterium]